MSEENNPPPRNNRMTKSLGYQPNKPAKGEPPKPSTPVPELIQKKVGVIKKPAKQ